MASLASLDDLESYLGRSFVETATADQAMLMLELASGAIRNYTRQTLSRATTTAALLRTCGPKLVLPERPVVSVASITVDGVTIAPAGYAVVRGVIWWGHWPVNASINRSYVGETAVAVTYTHGFDPLPSDIRQVCLAAAARSIDTPTGVQQEALGAYSVTYGSTDGGVLLNGPEMATLDLYRLRAL